MKTKILILLLRFLSIFPLGTLRRMGSGLGWCLWYLPTKMRKITLINLAHCFPDIVGRERDQLAKRSIQETCKTIAEMGPVWHWSIEKVLASVHEVEGLQLFQDTYAEKKGVIIVGPHLGNWELVGLYLNSSDCGQVRIMYQAPKSPALDKLIYTARTRGGMKLSAANSRGVAEVLSALRNGEVVGILPDQVPPPTGGEFAKFFGMDALTMSLLSRLLQKTGAKAVLAYAERIEGPKGPGFRVVVKEIDNKIYAKHMPESLQALNDAIEDAVRALPEQYQWEYKRFKRQLEGKQGVY